MKTLSTIGSATALALVMLTPAAALADGPQAVTTAAQHAGFAASSADLASARRHLHHTLNCLVGPEGEGFDAGPGNPCAAAGGAIPQTADAKAKTKLEQAATKARAGIAGADVETAKKAASETQAMLK